MNCTWFCICSSKFDSKLLEIFVQFCRIHNEQKKLFKTSLSFKIHSKIFIFILKTVGLYCDGYVALKLEFLRILRTLPLKNFSNQTEITFKLSKIFYLKMLMKRLFMIFFIHKHVG
ncbi:hypothetical protein BV375_01985 [Nostoc sp. 106C]|nr:hypothetical protein BV375_01985 [Nostoc sp. 106C]